MVTIELYGVPRLRAGTDIVQVEAASIGDALAELVARHPALHRTVVSEARLLPSYMIALNGLQMTADSGTALRDGDVLVLLSADAGG